MDTMYTFGITEWIRSNIHLTFECKRPFSKLQIETNTSPRANVRYHMDLRDVKVRILTKSKF